MSAPLMAWLGAVDQGGVFQGMEGAQGEAAGGGQGAVVEHRTGFDAQAVIALDQPRVVQLECGRTGLAAYG